MNPIADILVNTPLIVLDGAFATELERKGCDLNDPLWSAKVLLENPQRIAEVHTDYLKAGADCIITASYQATLAGFMRRGLGEREAEECLRLSVTLARQARERFWADTEKRDGRPRPLVAASVGPYGAYLADGSEYRGDYGIDQEELVEFHRQRLAILIAAGPDVLACETLPCLAEAKALVHLIEEHPSVSCWISFSARDGVSISNGESIRDCARWLDRHSQVAAIGINCTPPKYISSLIFEMSQVTTKPIVVYPNSGEEYDAVNKCWEGGGGKASFAEMAKGWYRDGARLIGGCCRTTPQDIHHLGQWRQTVLR